MDEFERIPTVLPASVVVGVDGSLHGEQALAWAADEARIRHRPLQIVHIGGPGELSRDLRADALATVTGTHPELARSTVPMRGDPVAQLLRLSATADLLVLGRSRHGALGTSFGSVTAGVLAHAHCPTAIVPPVASGGGSDVVVGISDSPGGLAALRFAFAEARRRDARLVAVRSCWAHGARLASAAALPIVASDLWVDSARVILEHCLARVRGDFPTLPVHESLTGEEPDLAFARLTPHPALLVLGCRRGDGARPGRLGPIVSWASRHIDYPMVVVGHPTHLVPQNDGPDAAAAPAEKPLPVCIG